MTPTEGVHNVLDLLTLQAALRPRRHRAGQRRRALVLPLAGRVAQLNRLLIARGAAPGTVVALAMPRSGDLRCWPCWPF